MCHDVALENFANSNNLWRYWQRDSDETSCSNGSTELQRTGAGATEGSQTFMVQGSLYFHLPRVTICCIARRKTWENSQDALIFPS